MLCWFKFSVHTVVVTDPDKDDDDEEGKCWQHSFWWFVDESNVPRTCQAFTIPKSSWIKRGGDEMVINLRLFI